MRVILDTNIFVSGLLSQSGTPGLIYSAWTQGAFTLLTCQEQLDELRATLRKPALVKRFHARQAGRLVNQLKALTVMVEHLPRVERSPDPEDDYLLAAAQAGKADFLVTGDKSGLLSLDRHRGTKIITAKEFAKRLA